jgi:hypothetical protein
MSHGIPRTSRRGACCSRTARAPARRLARLALKTEGFRPSVEIDLAATPSNRPRKADRRFLRRRGQVEWCSDACHTPVSRSCTPRCSLPAVSANIPWSLWADGQCQSNVACPQRSTGRPPTSSPRDWKAVQSIAGADHTDDSIERRLPTANHTGQRDGFTAVTRLGPVTIDVNLRCATFPKSRSLRSRGVGA